MDYREFYALEGEKPLDRLPRNGGFCRIFRTIACIGDSLSSGEFESNEMAGEAKRGWHDMFEYSWGQVMARVTGAKVYNFSRGGMTAKEYIESYAEKMGWWDPALACQAYVLALGVNDLLGRKIEIGSVEDVDLADWRNNAQTFCGYYAAIVQRIREFRADAKFFFMSIPSTGSADDAIRAEHARVLHEIAALFDNAYVIDLFAHAPRQDADFKAAFGMGGHHNPMGYIVIAEQVMGYVDYIVRAHPRDFSEVGFIGTEYRYRKAPPEGK